MPPSSPSGADPPANNSATDISATNTSADTADSKPDTETAAAAPANIPRDATATAAGNTGASRSTCKNGANQPTNSDGAAHPRGAAPSSDQDPAGAIDANLAANQRVMAGLLRSLDVAGLLRLSQTGRHYRQLVAAYFGRHIVVGDEHLYSRTPQFGWVTVCVSALGWVMDQTDVLDLKTVMQDRITPLAGHLGPDRVDYRLVLRHVMELTGEAVAKERMGAGPSGETKGDKQSEVIPNAVAAQHGGNNSAACETSPKHKKKKVADKASDASKETTKSEAPNADNEDLLATPRASVLNAWDTSRCPTPRPSHFASAPKVPEVPELTIPPAMAPNGGPTDAETIATAATFAELINQLCEAKNALENKSEGTNDVDKGKARDNEDREIPPRPDTPRPPPPPLNARPASGSAHPNSAHFTECLGHPTSAAPIPAHPGPVANSSTHSDPPLQTKRIGHAISAPADLNPEVFDPLRRPPTPHPAHLRGGRVLKDRTVFFEVRDPKPKDEPAVRAGYYYHEMRSYADFKDLGAPDCRAGSYADMPPLPAPRFVFPTPAPEPAAQDSTPAGPPTPAKPVAGTKRGRNRQVPGRGPRIRSPLEPPSVKVYLPDIPQPNVLVRNWAPWESPKRVAHLTPAPQPRPRIELDNKCANEVGPSSPPSAAEQPWRNPLGPFIPLPPVPGRTVRALPRGGWHFFSGRILGAEGGGPQRSVHTQFAGGLTPADKMIAQRLRVMNERARTIAEHRRSRSSAAYILRALADDQAKAAAQDRLGGLRAARRDLFILREEAGRARRARVQEDRWRSMQPLRPVASIGNAPGPSAAGSTPQAAGPAARAANAAPQASTFRPATSGSKASGSQAPMCQAPTSSAQGFQATPTSYLASDAIPIPPSVPAHIKHANLLARNVRGPVVRIFHDSDGNSFPLPQLHNLCFTPRTVVIFINSATPLHPALHGCGCDADAAAWRPHPEQKIVFNVLYDPLVPCQPESIWAHLLRLAPYTGRKVLIFTPVFQSAGRHLNGTMDIYFPNPFMPLHLLERSPPMANWPRLDGRKFSPANFAPFEPDIRPTVLNPETGKLFVQAINNIAATLKPRFHHENTHTPRDNTNAEASSSRNTLPPRQHAPHLTARQDPGDWSLVAFDALPASWFGMRAVDLRGVITDRLERHGIDMSRFHFLSLAQYRETVSLEDFVAEMMP